MTEVLLLVPPDRQVTRAVDVALEQAAARGAGLRAVAVLDPDAAERLASRMIDVGLLAEGITDRVSETLAREHGVRAAALLTDVAARARARAIACTTIAETGDPAEVLERLVAAVRPVAAVLVTEKRSWMTRLFAGTQPLRPPALSGCEVILVEED